MKAKLVKESLQNFMKELSQDDEINESLSSNFSYKEFEEYVYDNLDTIKKNMQLYGIDISDLSNITNYYDFAHILNIDTRITKELDLEFYTKYLHSLLEDSEDDIILENSEDDIMVGDIILSFDTNKISLYKQLLKEPDKYKDVIRYMESKGKDWDKINMIKVGRMILDAQMIKESINEKFNPTLDTYNIDEFESMLRKTKNAKQKFLKDNERGYWSYSTNEKISSEEIEDLVTIVGNRDAIYNFFNKETKPFNIKLKEIRTEKEKVKSNNIYDIMAAKQITYYEGSFQIKWWNDKIITIVNEFSKDTTLNTGDIYNFMRG